ncbi:uncharacterized protein BO97DRAFT_421393 [Aspergillus homomorphus CBS 101889]|uniref:Uncharacterized protein n=1 Tax=Aspergillus homomorphus (strain CBS 101889) TaxID=1450537 RepID=A0A395IAR4_ASPHC|nr:hypothetical protein BO97DRAFT_421393 [Aspergillus homomorphus CBS 101889]RAL16168.1 hypothetical protein BO97DRAFT_421393 [Aspergillus homomorphus CBS 101889]
MRLVTLRQVLHCVIEIAIVVEANIPYMVHDLGQFRPQKLFIHSRIAGLTGRQGGGCEKSFQPSPTKKSTGTTPRSTVRIGYAGNRTLERSIRCVRLRYCGVKCAYAVKSSCGGHVCKPSLTVIRYSSIKSTPHCFCGMSREESRKMRKVRQRCMAQWYCAEMVTRSMESGPAPSTSSSAQDIRQHYLLEKLDMRPLPVEPPPPPLETRFPRGPTTISVQQHAMNTDLINKVSGGSNSENRAHCATANHFQVTERLVALSASRRAVRALPWGFLALDPTDPAVGCCTLVLQGQWSFLSMLIGMQTGKFDSLT